MTAVIVVGFLILCAYVQPSVSVPFPSLTNPNSSSSAFTNHGEPNLVCTPTKATDVLVFFFANYFAHCATLKSEPGESIWTSLERAFFALLFPVSGVESALNAILRCPFGLSKKWPFVIIKPNDLQTAAKSGALVMVVRDPGSWEPREGESLGGIVGLDTPPPTSVIIERWRVDLSFYGHNNIYEVGDSVQIHGIHQRPKGYLFFTIPTSAEIEPQFLPSEVLNGAEDSASGSRISHISASYSLAKPAIAIVQAIYASVTLYRTKGDQLQRYGFAAFGLTVTPYLLMSVVNLIAQISAPQYPARYFVYSEVLKEARSRGGIFDGVIGSLIPAEPSRVKYLVETLIPGPDDIWRTRRSKIGLKILDTPKERGGVDIPESSVPKIQRDIAIPLHPQIKTTMAPDRRTPFRGLRFLKVRRLALRLLAVTISLLSIAIIGAISQFKIGKSTTSQRGILLTWILSGCILSPIYDFITGQIELQVYRIGLGLGKSQLEKRKILERLRLIFKILRGLLGAIAIAGFVVVGMELVDYGTCVQI